MKILLTTLNAKYVHTSLALWYIYQYCRPYHSNLVFKEYNINQELAWVCGEIYLEKADVVAFSCNIWNVELILSLCKRLKQVAPKTVIILGGPEVWDDPQNLMRHHPEVDFVIIGEGELTFKEWLDQTKEAVPDWAAIQGLVYRLGERIVKNPPRPEIKNLNIIPFPYPEDLSEFRQKLVYYETTRGCPFYCQYCLSANESGVRYFPMERVKKELLRFIEAGVRQVKLVDRSFNCNPRWAKEIWQFLIDHPGITNFHFEVVGDLLDDESIEILKNAPKGMFQFEIGIQSTYPETLKLIRRQMDLELLTRQVGRLIAKTNVFVHLDLIAGLPGEDYQTFATTFNRTLAIKPHRLQLGFLKLLRGSGIRARANTYGYEFTKETPYEVLRNHWLSYDDILKLKIIEDLLERYYNSGRFRATLDYLLARFNSAFEFFEKFGVWWKERGYDCFSHKSRDLYGYLSDFSKSSGEDQRVVRNLLKYDLLLQERTVELPVWAGTSDRELAGYAYSFWKNPWNIGRFIPEYEGLSIREIQRKVYFGSFDLNPDAVRKNPLGSILFKPTVLLFVYGHPEVKTFEIDREELTHG